MKTQRLSKESQRHQSVKNTGEPKERPQQKQNKENPDGFKYSNKLSHKALAPVFRANFLESHLNSAKPGY